MRLINGDKLEKHLDYLIQKDEQFAKECSQSPNNEFERQRRYCFEANALAYGLCKNVMNYYLVADTQVMNQWISVKDKLPDEDGWYLVCKHNRVRVAEWCKDCWYNESDLPIDDCAITYWQPLPELPKDGNVK